MTPSELNAQDELFVTLLRSAQESHATVSIRPFGGVRIQGDLQVKGLEPGLAIHLGGLKRRDQVDPKGTAVAVTILVGEEVLTFRTQLLAPIIATEGDTLFPPVLRVAWPSQGIQIHRTSARGCHAQYPRLCRHTCLRVKQVMETLSVFYKISFIYP